MNLEKIKDFSKNIVDEDKTSHDWKHALRVEKNALSILPSHVTSNEIESIRAACWLHDTIDEKVQTRVTVTEIQAILRESQADEEQMEDILHTIVNMSYSKNIDQTQSLSLVGQIVQDADRLDALGAIGIGRAFYYGGSQRDLMYDENSPRDVEKLTEQNYRQKSSVVNHFYEKLLTLKDLMNTEKGKKEAIKRTEFMENFLTTLFEEIDEI